MPFVYDGFTQDENIRSFRFEQSTDVAARKTARALLVVKADLLELSKAHVAVQDGPALCLHVLTTLTAKIGPLLPMVHTITPDEVAAFVCLKSGRTENVPHRRRRPKKPSEASQFHWPKIRG